MTRGGANDGKKGTQQRSTKVSGRHRRRERTQQHYHRPEKSGSDTIKGGRDTALEAEAQLYSDNITWKLEAEAQLYSDNITWK